MPEAGILEAHLPLVTRTSALLWSSKNYCLHRGLDLDFSLEIIVIMLKS